LKDVPVVVVTSLRRQVVPRARAVLVKPFSVDALLDALRPYLPIGDLPGDAGSHPSP
jgi:hypothetical protein